MAIDKAERAVIYNEAEYNGALEMALLASGINTGTKWSHLVSVEPSHASFNLSCSGMSNPIPLFLFNEDAGKQSDEIRGVKKRIWLVSWHEIVYRLDKVVFPHSVLSTHVFFFGMISFLAALEQALCIDVSNSVSITSRIKTYLLLSFYLQGQLVLGNQTLISREGSRYGWHRVKTDFLASCLEQLPQHSML